MWFARRKPTHSRTPSVPSAHPRGTPVRRKMKHSQSAKECDCYQESQDRNAERNYILSFFAKSFVSQQNEKKPAKRKNSKKVSEKNETNNSSKEKKSSKKEKKNSLKKATSITLKRNRIIPLNDGSGGCVLVSQTTVIKETPSLDEKLGSGNKKQQPEPGREETAKKRIGNILRRLSTVKRKAQYYLFRTKSEKSRVKTKPPSATPKPVVEFEKIPSQDDYIEEHFQADEPEVEERAPSEPVDAGRLSKCSSCYFTPMGSPASSKRYYSPVSVEEFEDEDADPSEEVEEGRELRPAAITVDSIRATLDAAVTHDRDLMRRRLRNGEVLYPNCDNSIWMRSCDQEVVEPIRGETSGMIPVWLKGTLLRNGPGSMRVGDMTFQHLFDASAHLHRFAIRNGEVTYQCRFLRSNTYLKNHAANRIVVNEFGTKSVPDPCQTIFKRVSALFNPGDGLSDNAMISVYPFGDEFYCFTEAPTILRIDPSTLETLERVNISKHVAVVNHTSHPHVMTDGTVFNQAMSLRGAAPHYSIVKFPYPHEKSKEKRGREMFETAEVVASVRARWPLHPSYMHSFGITDHYYVIVEQPLTLSVPSMLKSQLLGQPMCSCFRFYQDKPTLIHVVERDSGKLFKTFYAEAFFYLHIVNQFESENHVVIDICCYSDPSMLDCMYYDALKDMNKNPDYARMFRGRPLRFVLPLAPPVADGDTNLVTLTGSVATAWWRNGQITVKPELLCNLGCETPRINYSRHLGRPYRYFYAISSDVDLDNPGTLIKVDTYSRTAKKWSEPQVFPSEPVFVASPDPQTEDDGVVLSALVWGRGLERQVGLLVLDAASWHELGRTVFQTPSSVPKCLHGWFTPEI